MGDVSLLRSCSSFSHPRVRSRLERLMGSSVVRITDRGYMQRLQLRLREDHEENVRKRIHDREVSCNSPATAMLDLVVIRSLLNSNNNYLTFFFEECYYTMRSGFYCIPNFFYVSSYL